MEIEKENEESFLHLQKTILSALKNGSLSCLPGADGFADTAPVLDFVDKLTFTGSALLYFKLQHRENGFHTA